MPSTYYIIKYKIDGQWFYSERLYSKSAVKQRVSFLKDIYFIEDLKTEEYSLL